MNHATLSPSSSDIWINCPASIKIAERSLYLGEKAPKEDYLLEGTSAHKYAENALKYGLDLVAIPSGEMREAVYSYAEYVNRLREVDSQIFVEKEIVYTEDIWGTADCIVLTGDLFHVIDFKYGMGKAVKDDKQLKIYALGFLNEHPECEFITTHIVQPRIENYVSKSYTKKTLETFGKEVILPAGKKALEGSTTPSKGPWCKFCKAKAYCSEYAGQFGGVSELFSMSIEEIEETYIRLEALESYRKTLKDALTRELKKGKVLSTYELGKGPKKRSWRDLEVVRDKLKSLDLPLEVESPAQVEKRIGKKAFKETFSGLVKYSQKETLKRKK